MAGFLCYCKPNQSKYLESVYTGFDSQPLESIELHIKPAHHLNTRVSLNVDGWFMHHNIYRNLHLNPAILAGQANGWQEVDLKGQVPNILKWSEICAWSVSNKHLEPQNKFVICTNEQANESFIVYYVSKDDMVYFQQNQRVFHFSLVFLEARLKLLLTNLGAELLRGLNEDPSQQWLNENVLNEIFELFYCDGEQFE